MTSQLHRLRTVTLAISLSLCWSWAQPGVTGETAASGHETKPLILQSEYAKWRVSLPDDYPQLADYVYGVSAARFDMVGLQMMFGDGEARLIEQGLFRHIDWLQRTRGRGDLSPGDAEYVLSLNDMKTEASIPDWSSGRLLTPRGATVMTKADKPLLLQLDPRGCAVLARQ